ncbi:hypothetical protein FALB51S_02710 [Frigidibacter albus]
MFKTNVGGIDRILRVVVGLALIAGFFLGPASPYRLALPDRHRAAGDRPAAHLPALFDLRPQHLPAQTLIRAVPPPGFRAIRATSRVARSCLRLYIRGQSV